MRFLLKVNIPVETGNRAAQDGTLGKTIQKILESSKPEAAYFTTDGGQRTGFLILNMDNASRIPSIAEPWFVAFNAAVDFRPVMVAEDLQKASQDIASAAKIYSQELASV